MKNKIYVCIDLKSFYASVECVERGLDPISTNLVVADPERTEKTICLAITPAMKALGVKNRCRVFQIPKDIEYIMATPRMQLYIDYSADIYAIYLSYIAKEDIHVYSIDEVFLDITDYLPLYQMSAKDLSTRIMQEIYDKKGITATCGIGTNMYLAKVALDITAKHVKDHIGELTEESYQKTLWDHKPITDFWRIGKGISTRLVRYGIFTMRDIAHADENLLYKIFGIDAELLIDHAWGRETTTMGDIKKFTPRNHSLTSGQVLSRDYNYEECKLIVKEMADLLCLDLVEKSLVTQSISLYLSYSKSTEKESTNGSISMSITTNSSRIILNNIEQLYGRIVDKDALIRRVNISFNNVMEETYQQYNIFIDPVELEREHSMQKAMVDIKKRFGKNAILKGMNLEEAGTTIERNQQIGGHRSGS